MKYLVLRRFWSYGKLLLKGTIHDESEIRHVRLKLSEGVIVPAVSSSEVPREPGDEELQDDVAAAGAPSEEEDPAPKETTEEADIAPKKPLFRL